jgi:hypothetical protein
MPAPPDVAHAGLAAIDRLQRIAAAARAGEPMEAADAGWLADGLGRYLTGAAVGVRLDDALSLAVPPGGEPWWSAQRRAARDDAIRRLAATFSGPPTSRALAAAEAIRRYGATGWRHDRARGGPLTPDVRRKSLFELFTADEDPPTSMRRIYDIVCSG